MIYLCRLNRSKHYDELLGELGEILLQGTCLENRLSGLEEQADRQRSEARHTKRGTESYFLRWAEWNQTMAQINRTRREIEENANAVALLEDDVAACYLAPGETEPEPLDEDSDDSVAGNNPDGDEPPADKIDG